ncbi:hypothetical protein NQ318_000776 [Aromia moschata]|uniref:HEAT repeat-containing protein 1 n=1 Tax=Aromia moschata TaxID=1265417 RepID=A0AAV8YSK6_9CUCU|nr:hypothetical protein NQ318_000776 [Aromia moschata]
MFQILMDGINWRINFLHSILEVRPIFLYIRKKMSTSLAEQLQRLAAPQTTVFKRDKKRASLLFDPKEAAGLKRETVYQIGLEGLEELISKNEVFDKYRNTIFHITSKDFERSVQSSETNDLFTGAIEYSENITEEQVSHMLPLILKGLNSSIGDFCAASYIVMARLVAKINLSDKILDKFVEKVSGVKVPQLKAEACLVLIVLYQSQTQYSNIPSAAVMNLSEKEWFPKILQNLNSSGSYILPFLEKLIRRCTEEGTTNDLKLARDMVTHCLEQIKLEELYVGTILNCVLDSIKPKMDYSADAKTWLTEVIHTLEKQYPNSFDKEVYSILSSKQEKGLIKRKKCLSKILKNTMTYKGKFEIFDKLYHPNPKYRSEAVNYLLENYSLLNETDQELIKNSLMDRLGDQSVEVSQATGDILKGFLEVLRTIPPKQRDSYHKYIVSLILSYILPEKSSFNVSTIILEILENYYNTSSKEVSKESYKDKSLHIEKYLKCLENIVTKTEKRDMNLGLIDFSLDIPDRKYFVLLSNILIKSNKRYRKTLEKESLTYLLELLKSKKYENREFVLVGEILPSLLMLLSDTDRNIRKLTFDVLELFMETSTTKSKAKKHESDLDSVQSDLLQLSCNEDAPVYLKAGILGLLSHINNFQILEKTAEVTLQFLQQNPETVTEFKAVIVRNVINRIEAKVISELNFNTKTWKLIEYAIRNDKTIVFNDVEDKVCLTALILNQFEKEIFLALEENVLKCLLDLIVEISSSTQSPEILPAANRIFKHINLDAKLILDQLMQMRDVQSPKQNVAKKKRRVSVVPTVEILDTLEWKKGVTVLEFIQDKKKMWNTSCLLPVLFDILKKCLDFDEQAPVEYPKQLVLSSILHCCLKMDGEAIPENVFNMELVVQCIRASQNPQTHHHALLVLAHSANLIPTQVLHHMMAIFTFMGSSVLRHDDAYSFQIITKIVDTIIPILVKDNHISNIAMVLRVFVDALLDVPEHRRIPLYKQLLTRFDVKENLYMFLLLIFESQVLHGSQEKSNKDSNLKRLEIAATLCREFAPDIVIDSCIKLIKYLSMLPDEKDDTMTTKDSDDSFNIITHTPKDFRHFKYLLLKFTATLLASHDFITQVAALSDDEELSLEGLYKEMIINILQYIQRISKLAENASGTPQAHYWKVVLHHSHDILDSINAMLTPQMFLLVTKGLMVHNLSTIRRRILELLNTKLQYNSQFFSDCDTTEIYALIPPIISIIECVNDQIELDQETIIQTALLSLKLIVKSLAPDNPEKFVQVLEFITNLIKSGKAQNNVLASVLLCLAELCISLRAHAISSLADFMPAVLKVLKQQKYEEVPSVLLRSTITTLEKMLDSMPLFLSPYLEKLLLEISMLMCKWGYASDDQKLQPFVNKLTCIKQKIGSIIPSRVLLPAVEQCYSKLIEKKCFTATSALMDILAENLTSLKGPDINANLPELTNFFLNALKFRSDGNSSLEEANTVEGHIIQAFTVLILKLSETSFRPFLSSGIAQSLKGLFVLFAGHFLNNAAQVLDACNKVKNEELYFADENKSILLLEYVIKTLNSVFMYDSQKFINKERFDVLMQPLVDQLENNIGGTDQLVKRNENLLTPCLVSFAVAIADDALWKQMNYQILLKMRHNSPQNRLVALHCLTEIVKRLGEDFLPLLPETIPFLAELLEDEEENVEKACQKAVQEMEKVLGEPLQKYF